MKAILKRWRRQDSAGKAQSTDSSRDEKNGPGEKDGDKFNNPDLSEAQIDILKAQAFAEDDDSQKQGLLAVYRYASRAELLLVVVSTVCSIASGLPIPIMIVIFGQLVGNISSQGVGAGTAESQTSSFIPGGNRDNLILYLVYLAIAELVLTFIATAGWQHIGRRLARKVRERYLGALLRQNVGFFDTFGTGKVTSHITADMNAIQEATSEKVGLTLRTIATVIGSFVVGFVQYWALALILSSSLLAIMLFGGAMGIPMKKASDRASGSASQAGIIAEETFAAVKTVTALNMQQRLTERYRSPVMLAATADSTSKAFLGLMLAATMCIVNLMYGLAFWQGNRFIQSNPDSLDLSGIIITLLAIMTGSFTIASIAPSFQAFVAGATSAAAVFKVIDRESPIDVYTEGGRDASQIKGEIEFRDVHLVYPSRPDISALRGFNLTVPAGKTTALVGPSGSGKTSIVGLLERFYNSIEGLVTIDGVDIREYNLASLRRQISLVSQEPTLFACSIHDNIAFGLPEAEVQRLSVEELKRRVRDAARRAHAHEFVSNLPRQYDSVIGDVGVSLSGGQRQRIAIARAIISNPRILLLDEATSALDTDSEHEVQAALMDMSRDRTTISIAHRLSTVRHADSIAVISDGHVHEQGTHQALLEKGGIYKRLVDAQSVGGYRMDPITKQKSRASADGAELSRKSTTLSRSKSQGQGDLENDEQQEDKESKPSVWQVIKFGYSLNFPERWLLLLGCGFSVISGAVQPVTAVLFAKSIFALATPPGYGRGVNFWAALYLMMAFLAFFSLASRSWAFGKASAALTRRLRMNLFAFILSRETVWFDRSENCSGMLSSLVSTEPTNVAGVSGSTLGALVDGMVTLVGGSILALALGWKLALVCISLVPLVMVSGFLQVVMLGRFQEQAKKTYEKSASYASELSSGIRTVAAFSREDYVWELYHQQLFNAERAGLRWVLVASLFYAMSQAVQYLIFALVFWYGGGLVSSGEYGPEQFFIVLAAVIFGAQSAAQFFGFAPDISKARVAAARVMQMVGSEPDFHTDDFSHSINRSHTSEKTFDADAISFRNVTFRYEGLTGDPVLNHVSFDVASGRSVALVGPSGSGKSTTISLITRNNQPNSGRVTVNGNDLSSIHPSIVRDQVSLVSQDPILFTGSIRENLIIGMQPDAAEPSEEAIVNSCKDAYIWDFIASLPEGLDTVIGSKGVTLSGGQRQRVTIARALLRNPRILLLDEATSALDSESEGMVQKALKRASEGRTTIAIAHRLSTIRESDCIYVLDKGRVVQQGTHQELISTTGMYRSFVEEQSMGS